MYCIEPEPGSYNMSNNSTHVESRKLVCFLVERNSYHICRCSISRAVESTNFTKMCFLCRILWCPNSRANYWSEMYDARADCTTRVQLLWDCLKSRSRCLDEREHWRTPHKTRLRDSRKEFPQGTTCWIIGALSNNSQYRDEQLVSVWVMKIFAFSKEFLTTISSIWPVVYSSCNAPPDFKKN